MDILVINQNLFERRVIQPILEKSNYQVTFVDNTDEAMQITKERVFRLIIADATEQEQNTREFIKLMRRAPSAAGHTYILLLVTENQNGKIQDDQQGINADDYLTKPITPHNLKARVAVGIRILSLSDTLTQVNKKLENLAMYDNLTGLMNRQAFFNISQGELERARRNAEGISVIAIDVNNFKAINQEYGHSIGDEVLIIIAQIIREKSRPYDCLGRWSGDQFLITLPGLVSADAEKIVRRIINSVESSGIQLENGKALNVTLSAGIASVQTVNAYADVETFLQSAVQALNNSKQNNDGEISVVFI